MLSIHSRRCDCSGTKNGSLRFLSTKRATTVDLTFLAGMRARESSSSNQRLCRRGARKAVRSRIDVTTSAILPSMARQPRRSDQGTVERLLCGLESVGQAFAACRETCLHTVGPLWQGTGCSQPETLPPL